ncbi:MAG: hypothetical protein HC809_03190 [Gammaproteobacteria bacterium]|nr:hypothetical protein [Gammaproteobacteria bacterium]
MMRMRIGMLLLAACAQACSVTPAERQTSADVRAREPVLFEQRASWGYITKLDGGLVVHEANGLLVLTPTALYFVDAGFSRIFSYAAITDVAVDAVPGWRNVPAVCSAAALRRTTGCWS